MMMAYLTSLCLLALTLAPTQALVVTLTSSNFDQYVNGDKFAFVEFYAPWCGHCKRLEPAYEEVGKAFDNSDSVVIGKVDADSEKALGSKFGVRGYPTLKYFPQGSTEPKDYSGGRTAADIIAFVTAQAGVKVQGTKKEISHVVDLNPSNFNDIVLDTNKNVLVEFYAPWCGHCKSLAPVYEEVGAAFSREDECVVAKLDADAHRSTAEKFSISGFPTIKFFPKTNKDGQDYERGRSAADFVKFLNEKCGTHRQLGGELSEEAGVVPDMNGLANRFMSTAVDSRDTILSEAQSLAEGHSEQQAQYYVKVMKKVQDKGDEYVTMERDRLGRILQGDVGGKKVDEITKKRNVLRKFEL
ncbi:uncharacterized protein LOC135345112 [Halichondria panicea]|uniref:uncharacterized protein LOC135345112 n=1 Tax=Halichondria panicea TaxID=6063 RepID=UPI00312BCAD2